MKLELIKGNLYDFYIIRFTGAGIQHITTNGYMLGVTTYIPCSHDRCHGEYIGVSISDYEIFKLMIGMPIVSNTIGGVPFKVIDPTMVPDVNKTLDLESTGGGISVSVDPQHINLAMTVLECEAVNFLVMECGVLTLSDTSNYNTVCIMGME